MRAHAILSVLVIVAGAMTVSSASAAPASGVVISQFTTRGPAGGNDEYVEIFNAGGAAVAIGGWTLQGCASGTPGNPSVRATVPAGTQLLPGRYYLFVNTAASGYSLGVAGDATYSTGFTDFAASNFAGIRLVAGNGLSIAPGTAVDGVGSAQSPCHEGTGIITPTSNGSNNNFLRSVVSGIVQDDDNNATDFPAAGAAVGPRNSATPSGGATPSVSLSSSPLTFSEAGGSATVTATLSAISTQDVSVALTFSGTATLDTDYSATATSIFIPAGLSNGSVTLSGIDDAVFEGDETAMVSLGTVTNATTGAPSSVVATVLEDDAAPPPVIGARIYQIQGASHLSPMNGMSVTNVPGIVTAVADNGFYVQDADGDGDPATSDGLFVFTSSAPAVSVGQQVLVSGTVSEFRPGGASTNLTSTEIVGPTVTPFGGGGLFVNSSITPTVLGIGGRMPPADVIDDDTSGQVEVAAQTTYDPAQDGIDFYESLEGMLVQVNNARVTGPTNGFGEIWVVADDGANATGASLRGGVTLVERATGVDYNPERIQLDDDLPGIANPVVNVGDSIALARGVVTYNFGNYEIQQTQSPLAIAGALVRDVSHLSASPDRLSVAAYNVENLDPLDPPAKFAGLGTEIVNTLGSPDILTLSEVQDDNGPTNNGVVSAGVTLSKLVAAIAGAGGPNYSYVQIDPVNNADGGEPGGNIRVVQLYNPARVSFVGGTVGSGDSTSATATTLVGGKLGLSLSPGRVEPLNSAWSASRKPLAATYDFNGRRLLIVNNHFNSKGGDQPLFGVNQPPVLSSEAQRRAQAQLVHDFVAGALALDPNARVVVLGDLNDFDFSPPLRILRKGALGPNGEDGVQPVLNNLGTDLVPDPAERYSYVFEGNSQELDHILTSAALSAAAPAYQAIHTNAEFSVQTSDHDPLVASFLIPVNATPSAQAGADRSVTGSAPVTLDGTASSDADGSIASFAWVQSAGAPVSLSGADTATPSFTAPSAAGDLQFTLTVTDNEGASASDVIVVGVAADTVPDAYGFTPVSGVDPGSVQTSGAITVSGINAPAPISVSGGAYSIDGGAFTAASGSIQSGQSVRVQLPASASFGMTTTATLNIGGVTAEFRATTRDADTTPMPFGFTPVDGATPGSAVLSNSIVVLGIDAPAAISVVGGQFCINSSPCTSMVGATVNNGDSVRVRVIAPSAYAATATATLTIDTVGAEFRVTTVAADTTPDAFQFEDLKLRKSVEGRYVSGTITVTGINAPTPISVSGGSQPLYSVNGGGFVSAPGEVHDGDQVQVSTYFPAPNSKKPDQVTHVVLNVGGVTDTWTVSVSKK